MVLERHPKKFKHMVRIMLSQLVMHENITTTKAKVNAYLLRLDIFAHMHRAYCNSLRKQSRARQVL